jgi:hypothetical protein
MATYYVRKTGSDSNNGTSAATAWLTIGKALGASGMSSGDTVWIGAGVYRENVTVGMTSPTVETFINGDLDGSHTGDIGEVIMSQWLVNDMTAPTANSSSIWLNGVSHLTFQDIVFMSWYRAIDTYNNGSQYITLRRCSFLHSTAGYASYPITIQTAADATANWTIDSCFIIRGSQSIGIYIHCNKASAADINLNIVIKNCFFAGGNLNAVQCDTTGGNTFKVGGVTMYNNTMFGGNDFLNVQDNYWSTTYPCYFYNNLYIMSNGYMCDCNSVGQIIEDYNVQIGSRAGNGTNVTLGAHSVVSTDGQIAPLFYFGNESLVGSNLKPFTMPRPGSPILGFGNYSGSPSVDILNITRPAGVAKFANGTATSGGNTTLTNSGATWGVNMFIGYTVKIISGTGSGQTKTINANTTTVLTVDGNWKTNPDSTSVYEIYATAMSSTGKATSGSTTSLTDSNALWGTNMWNGYILHIDSGTGSGQSLVITSNTNTVLSFASATAPDSTSNYSIYKATGIDTINPGVGCYEAGQTAIQETGTVRTGSNSLRIPGAGYHDFVVPVNAVATTITIYAQYDSAYSGTKPSMNIVNGTECGVANATATQAGASGSWELLTLTFTPTAAGIITVRLISSSTVASGNAFFDDFAVS